jgi:hypothetical protein
MGQRAPVSRVRVKAAPITRVAIEATEVTEGIALIAEAANASNVTAGGIGDIVDADVAGVALPAAEREAAVEAPAAISRSRPTRR